MSFRLLAVVLCAVAFCFPPSAFAQKKYGPGVTDTEIKIGQTYVYSGPLSAYATMARAQSAVFDKINAEGGINGRKIKFISLDDGFSPAKTVEQTRRLLEQENVLLLFNSLGTQTNMSVIKYITQKKVPHLFPATGATIFGDHKTYPWSVAFQPTYHTEMVVFTQYIKRQLPNAKVGVLYQNDDAGRDFLKGIHDGFAAQTSKFIVKEISYEVTDPTVDSQTITLQQSGADVLILTTPPKASAQAIRKVASIGWKPTILLTYISASIDSVMKPAGLENAVGVISTAWLKDPTDPARKDEPAMKDHLAFMQRYYADGNPSESFNVYGQVLAGAVIQVLKQCGDDLTRENVLRQAENLKDFTHPLLLPGIKANTGPTNHYALKQMQLQRFDGQKWVRVGELISE